MSNFHTIEVVDRRSETQLHYLNLYYFLQRFRINSICSYVFSCKMFVKSDFFVYSHLEHSSDEEKRDYIFFLTLKSMKID